MKSKNNPVTVAPKVNVKPLLKKRPQAWQSSLELFQKFRYHHEGMQERFFCPDALRDSTPSRACTVEVAGK